MCVKKHISRNAGESESVNTLTVKFMGMIHKVREKNSVYFNFCLFC